MLLQSLMQDVLSGPWKRRGSFRTISAGHGITCAKEALAATLAETLAGTDVAASAIRRMSIKNSGKHETTIAEKHEATRAFSRPS